MCSLLNLRIRLKGKRGLIVGIGGASDIVLARAYAELCMRDGAKSVDIAQPVDTRSLLRKLPDSDERKRFSLVTISGLSPSSALRHNGRVPNLFGPPERKGKGLQLSAALELDSGDRYVVASESGFSALVKSRCRSEPYEFVLAVDGGGDVLSAPDDEFDRYNLRALAGALSPGTPLFLLVVGLGADGHIAPRGSRIRLPGWRLIKRSILPFEFSDLVESGLRQAGRWHPCPVRIGPSSSLAWRHGPHVPQIVALALRGIWPSIKGRKGLVQVWRRGGLLSMNLRSLKSIWVLKCTSKVIARSVKSYR